MERVFSLDEQIKAMAEDWPQFKRKRRPRYGGVTWIGELKPQFGVFGVQISYNLKLPFPLVRVVSPELRYKPGNPEGALPHVYPPTDLPIWKDGPFLCLFDPAQNEWHQGMLISRKTVPWTLDWLACYEWWTMTDEWPGGGRHPDEPIPTLRASSISEASS